MVDTVSGQRAAELLIQSEGWILRVPLERQPIVLGRSKDCDVQLRDEQVSRRHCRLVPAGSDWLVEDLGSFGGTFLDARRIEQSTALRPGARLEIGNTRVHLELRPAGASVLSGDPVRDARNVDLLLQAVQQLYATEDLDELLRTIVDRAIVLAGGDRGGLMLSGPHGALEAGIARDKDGRDLPPDEILTRSLPRRALETRRAVVLTDTRQEAAAEGLPESVLASKLGSVLCVPLPGPVDPAGVLYVDGQRPASAFGPAELCIFEALAAHGAFAVERTRFRESQARREREARQRVEAENASLKAQLGTDQPIGESQPMRSALELIRRVASSEATICLSGETGSGKEVLARWLHRLSPRSNRPFVAVDCGAIPEGLIESELFGHERGAFTGAAAARKGRFREAEGGTVFLDEIGELPLSLQTRLLRVLQERTVQPVGASSPVPIDVRIVCATHRDLSARVAEGQFRQDLYYRIAVLTVPIPPLRERNEDILLLARHFLARFAAAHGTTLTGFTREASEALLAHSWPGNVRELEHRVQRAALLAQPPYAGRADLGFDGAAAASGPAEAELPLPTLHDGRAAAVERFERTYAEEALRRAGGNVSKASALADVTRQAFHRLLRIHGIDRRSSGPET